MACEERPRRRPRPLPQSAPAEPAVPRGHFLCRWAPAGTFWTYDESAPVCPSVRDPPKVPASDHPSDAGTFRSLEVGRGHFCPTRALYHCKWAHAGTFTKCASGRPGSTPTLFLGLSKSARGCPPILGPGPPGQKWESARGRLSGGHNAEVPASGKCPRAPRRPGSRPEKCSRAPFRKSARVGFGAGTLESARGRLFRQKCPR